MDDHYRVIKDREHPKRHRAGVRALGRGPATIDQALREERAVVRAWLHDRTLQMLEFVAAGGYEDEPDVERLRQVAAAAADDLRAFIESREGPAVRTLARALTEVVSEARLVADGALVIELVPRTVDRKVSADHVAALADATREALANIRKHAHATRVVITYEASADATVVTVGDDGVGFVPATTRRGFGITHSINGRMDAAGGRAKVHSEPGRGTLVVLHIGARAEVALPA